MNHWRKALMAGMGLGMALGLAAGSARAGSTVAGKAVKGGSQAAPVPAPSIAGKAGGPPAAKASAKVDPKVVVANKTGAPPVTVRIRPPSVAVVPPAPVREPVLLPVAIEDEAQAARPAKVALVRAYALDGGSFFQNGQLIRIQGLEGGGAGGEHARQRLQQALDAGQVTVLPVAGAAGGEMLAVVRVNGHDVAETMAGSN